ncbi:proteasome subunit alpha [candidate division KSB3 bacterium]|uniref:Proteasome subunit alpha n=1 Tax=candidate division KSB3 bacterium TaxID=2044937 RepID=A0A9D5JWN3_9BACT|nr:proteasome subunit alpha [candidate division KSB3 bacterium]MBD3325091.1 proteasome subunit alpha [candidate division KSB3 bacterium]
MPMPYYVSPEQMMQDKAEYARKGIAKGKSLIALEYADGILLAAENPSSSLSKISEIYDCISFAGVGKYSEFENLRKSGIRYADVKGYTYSRADVTGKSLANAYSQVIGNIFTKEIKPLEVEILVVEVGDTSEKNSMYHILFDGSISDYRQYSVIGGHADNVNGFLREHYRENFSLNQALSLCHAALEKTTDNKQIQPEDLEIGILDRNIEGRKFRRLLPPEIQERTRSGFST